MALAYYENEHDSTAKRISMISSGIRKMKSAIFAVLGLVTALMFWTYSINDPALFGNSNDNIPQNAFGYFGSSFADALLQPLGRAVWVLPIALFAWAIRSFYGRSTSHLINRIVFLPVALVISSVFAATFSLSASWPFAGTYGMGGGFGDLILGGLIKALPFGVGFSLFVWSIIFSILACGATAFVSGLKSYEVRGLFGKIVDDLRFVALQILLFIQRLKEKRANRPLRAPLNQASNEGQTVQMAQAAIAPKAPRSTLNLGTLFGSKSSQGRASRYLKGASTEIAQPTEPEAPIVTAPMNLSERISAVVSRNAEQHHSLLKRNIYGEEATAPDFMADQYLTEQSSAPEYVSEADYQHYNTVTEPYAEYPEYLENPEQFEVQEFDQLTTYAPAPLAARDPIVQRPQASAQKVSQRASKEAQPSFAFEAQTEPQFEKPSLSMLQSPDTIVRHVPPREALEASARQLEAVLADYGVQGEVVAVRPGPVVTMYELEPAAGLKASRVIGLADDIARSMSALTARVATIPGRSVIGVELPNDHREMVLLREIFAAKNYGDSKLPLPLALGKDIAGEPIVANLAKMPHLLIAGTTGSGKSVAINTMILSLLYHATPDEVRMIMIDPKMLELSVYDDIPHLLSPVVTDPKKAVVALKWVVGEMEERYRKMSKMGVRNIDGYNSRVKESLAKGEAFTRTVQTGFDDISGEAVFETEEYAPETMPYIVVIVDEMADLMMVAGKEIEACIQRLAQMARASGIHLIMATQRPSVDVITGTIKANFPTRISFQVTSKIDSRTILGEMGAEQLLGMGDMLYMASGGRVTRVHGPFVSDQEVEEVVRHLKAQGEPKYLSGVLEGPEDGKASDIDAVLGLSSGDGEDALYDEAVMIVARDRKCSTSYIQRKLSIGYNKAAKLVERMEEENVVSEANHVGKREILVPEIRH